MATYTIAHEGGGSPIGSIINGTLNSALSGQLDSNLAADMKLTMEPTELKLTGDRRNPVASMVESTLDVLNIPHLTLDDIKDVLTPRVRMHIPNYQQMSFKLLGVELFSWCLSGETQVITHPFLPNKFEQCRIECPDEDTRPFPSKTPSHGQSFRVTAKPAE
jgi:hypothetical protein